MNKKYPYKEVVLPNKLPILLYPIDSVMSVYLVLYVRVGAVFENPKERGISHFVEHMPFLGTKDFPSSLSLSQAADEIGLMYNAMTGKFDTRYWAKLPYTNLDKGIDFLHNFVFKPLNKSEDVEKEKNVILSEYNDFWHNPDRRFNHEAWRKRFRQENHPYSYRPMGIPETIQVFKRKDILRWRKKYYNPANMILSIAGNFNETLLIEKLEKTFGKNEVGTKNKEPKFSSNNYSGFTLFVQNEPRPQIKFFITFPTFGFKQISRQKRLPLVLLNDILGGGISSRLSQRLREKERFVYSIRSGANFHTWMGSLTIWGSVPVEKLLPTMAALKEELDKLVTNGVTKKEINLSKKYLSALKLMKFDNPESIASHFGDQVFDEEEVWFPEDYKRELDKITEKELNALIKEIINYSKINISLLGNIQEKTIEEIKKLFKS